MNAVHPGIIDTSLVYDPATGAELVPTNAFGIPRMSSVDEIARYVLFAASDEAAFSMGFEFMADGGYGLGLIRCTIRGHRFGTEPSGRGSSTRPNGP